jgi:fatty acid desaturase
VSRQRGRTYQAWRRGQMRLIGAYVVAAAWIGVWLWDHQWKPIVALLIAHAWGSLTLWIGASVASGDDGLPASGGTS